VQIPISASGSYSIGSFPPVISYPYVFDASGNFWSAPSGYIDENVGLPGLPQQTATNPMQPPFSSATSLAIGADNNIWFTGYDLGYMTPAGTYSGLNCTSLSTAGTLVALTGAASQKASTDPIVWYATNQSSAGFAYYAVGGSVECSTFALTGLPSGQSPTAMVSGPGGKLWLAFADGASGSYIVSVDKTGLVTIADYTTTHFTDLAYAPFDGTLYAQDTTGAIDQLTGTPPATTICPGLGPLSTPMVTLPDGTVAALSGNGTFVRIASGYAGTANYGSCLYEYTGFSTSGATGPYLLSPGALMFAWGNGPIRFESF
jgi:hypothetical protein